MRGQAGDGDDGPRGPHRSDAVGRDDRRHVPVLVDRVDQLLAPAIEAATRIRRHGCRAGRCHPRHGRTHPGPVAGPPRLSVVGIDRDPQALSIAGQRIAAAGLSDRVELVHAVYDRIGEVIA